MASVGWVDEFAEAAIVKARASPLNVVRVQILLNPHAYRKRAHRCIQITQRLRSLMLDG